MLGPLRSYVSATCFAIGGVWAVAAALKMIFGIEITFPLLPPLALEKVDVMKSFIAALAWFAAGAVIRRLPFGRRGAHGREPVGARSNWR